MNFFLSAHKRAATGEFLSFCRQMDFLSHGTGLFMTDKFGKIINSRHLEFDKDSFPVLCDIVSDDDYDRYLSYRHQSNAFAMCKKNSDGKDFIVSLPYKNGYTKGVCLKCGDRNFTTLSDYYLHLCTYKDFLSSLSTLTFSPNSEKALSIIFNMKLSGIFNLLKLSEFEEHSNKNISCPVLTFIQKVKDISDNTNNSSLSVSGNIDANVYIDTTPIFLKMLISCTALCFRKASEDVNLDITQNRGELTFCFETNCRNSAKFDIYESSVIYSLKTNNIDFQINLDGSKYKIELHHKCYTKEKAELHELAIIDKILQELVGDKTTLDLFSCIAIN